MCIKKSEIIRPHSNTYLKALSGAILDTSPAVRKSYAVSVGYVAHLASDNTLIKFIEHLKKVYCENSGIYKYSLLKNELFVENIFNIIFNL